MGCRCRGGGGKCSRKMRQVGVVADRAVAMVRCYFDGSCCPKLLVVAGWIVVATGAMVFMGCRRWGGGEQSFSEDAEGGDFGRWSRDDGKMLFRRLLLSEVALICWMGSHGDGSEGFEGIPSSALRGAIGLRRCGGWRFWPMEPWRWGNAVSAAVVDRLCSLLLRCCWMDSRGNGSGGFNGMPLIAAMMATTPTTKRGREGRGSGSGDWRGGRWRWRVTM